MPGTDMDSAQNRDLSISETYRHNLLTFQEIRTQDPAMIECLRLAREAAQHDLPIMILGENGTGKNLLAQAVHTASNRVKEPFMPVNCSALPESLLESELFGHEKGAFTDARRVHRGKFEMAAKGTLFLDEIGDLSLSAQAKILRVVEYKQYERVGGEEILETKARFITATNKDLRALVDQGAFRQDLYYRLRGFTIELPPLRERKRDLIFLADELIEEANRKFSKSVQGLTREALDLLRRHQWPGNTRELKSVLSSAVIVEKESRLSGDNRAFLVVKKEIKGYNPPAPAAEEGRIYTIEEMERRHISSILLHTRGTKARAAKLLDISRPTLDRKIAKYNIRLDGWRDAHDTQR